MDLPKNKFNQFNTIKKDLHIEIINIIEHCSFIQYDEFDNFIILDIKEKKL